MAYRERSYSGSSLNFETPRGVKQLIIFTVGCYLANYLARLFDDYAPFSWIALIFEWLKLTPGRLLDSFALWQPLTYIFVHEVPSPWHVLWNMLTLWFMGRDVEQAWGRVRFIQYYVLCGIGAGLVVTLVDLIFRQNTTTLGASGAVCGVMLAFGMLFPDREIFFFPLPVAIKAKYFVGIMAAVNLLMIPAASGVSYIAHVAGFLVGFLYFKTAYNWGSIDLLGTARAQYREWKLARAKRKFQVYMNKQRRD
jgi:membrane associated rhomboid family serine protease